MLFLYNYLKLHKINRSFREMYDKRLSKLDTTI